VIVLGIDPGEQTGVARYEDGELIDLDTRAPVELLDLLREVAPDRVVYEDSRLQSRVWVSGAHAGARAKGLSIARDIGRVDARCADLVAACERLSIPAHGISPQAKGAKMDAEQFARLTGWARRCNQHERDAAMVAWPYRRAGTEAR